MKCVPKGSNQKFKLYRLARIMQEQTDDEHYITMPEIMDELAKYNITADRKSLYNDLRDLSVLGIDVEGEPIGNRYHYHVVNRAFELPELKLLVDAIQSSKFITEKKTNALIKKLETLVSKYDAQKLQRQVYVSGRIKTMNESIYYTVDAIHNAISENKKIKFQYYQWNVKKEMELRHNGAWYHISPWGLSWYNENYYLVGYDSEAGKIKHYRVDKMLHIRLSAESREGKEYFKKLDMADYAKKSFGMFRGNERTVRLLVKNNLAGVIIDRFGKDVRMIPADEQHFTVNVDIHVSKQFFGWVFSLGEGIKIIGPGEVEEQMKEEARRLLEQYENKGDARDFNEYYELRQVCPDDAEEATGIEAICFPPSEACTLPIMKERIQYAARSFLVAMDRETGKMVGFINALCTDEESLRDELFTDISLHNPNGKNVMICSVAVLPQYQGRGIAREMVRELLLEQRKLGKKCAILTCVPGKVKMYKKFGFMDRGESQSTWGGEKWHEMWCTLNS